MPYFDHFSFNNSTHVKETREFSFSEWDSWHCDSFLSSASNVKLEWLSNEEEEVRSPKEQEISKCLKHMKELANYTPDHVCELSLRDLVELPKIAKEAKNLKSETKAKKGSRSQSMEVGSSLLKIFFPIPSSGKKNRNSNGFSGSSNNRSSKSANRSNSSRSSKYSSISNSSGSSKYSTRSISKAKGKLKSDNDSSSKASSKDLMEKKRKESVGKNSEKKCVEKKQNKAVLRRNCSRNSLVMKSSASKFLRSICSFKH